MEDTHSNSDPPSGWGLFLKLASDFLKECSAFMKSIRELGETVNSLIAAFVLIMTTVVLGHQPAQVESLARERPAEKPAEVTPNFRYPDTAFGDQSGPITTDPTLGDKAKRADKPAPIITGSLGNQNKAGAKKATPEADVASNQEPITETIAHKVSNCLWGIYRAFVPKHEEAKPTA